MGGRTPTVTASAAEALHSVTPDLPARRGLLVGFGVLSVVTLGLGGWLTMLGLGPWYDALQKPWFQPPSWFFTPAWTLILGLLAVATWQVCRRGASRGVLALYGLQLVLNAGWSLFFFTLANPSAALVDILVLEGVLVAMVVSYRRVHPPAGWMLVPYVVWLGLAGAINLWIVLHN